MGSEHSNHESDKLFFLMALLEIGLTIKKELCQGDHSLATFYFALPRMELWPESFCHQIYSALPHPVPANQLFNKRAARVQSLVASVTLGPSRIIQIKPV